MNQVYYKVLNYIQDNEDLSEGVNITPILLSVYPESKEQSFNIKNLLERLKSYNYIHSHPTFIEGLGTKHSSVETKLNNRDVVVEITELGREVINRHELNKLTLKSISKQNTFNKWLIILTLITVIFLL